MKLFGNATDSDVEYILDVVRELLETSDSVGEALGVESNLLEDLTMGSTETDGQASANGQTSRGSQNVSAGRKTIVSVLVVSVVAFVSLSAFFAYRRNETGRGGYSTTEGDQPTMAATADQEELYAA